MKAQFTPTEYSWVGRSESCTAKRFLGPSTASKPGAMQNSSGLLSTVRAVGWELDGQELST